jgi:molybdate transport system substrate-binding protein
MNRIVGFVVSAFAVVILAIYGLYSNEQQSEVKEPVVLYCAASNRAVIEACCRDYEQKTGYRVQVQYGASQTLLSSIEVSGSGDLFLPADDSYLTLASERSFVTRQWAIASMRAVLAVRKRNPKRIESFDDLLRSDVSLVQASPESAAIGKTVRDALSLSGDWDRLAAATIAFRTSVTDVANDLVIGAADVGIVYDVVLPSYPDLEVVELPELSKVISQVSIGLLSHSRNNEAAIRFVEYLTDEQGGLTHYSAYGFDVANAK